MKELLKKEFKLTAGTVTYIFIVFGLMAFIPGYPILVSAFFVCLGLQITFQFAREYNDVLYTVLLPVNKGDAVKARYLFCMCIQMMSFLLTACVSALRMSVLRDVKVYAENVMLSANFTFLGFVLFIYMLFNVIFIGGFYKTAYYYGKNFVIFAVISMLTVGIAETIHHIPGLKFLNATSGSELLPQLGIFACGIILYIVGTLISMNKSIKRFEKLDL